MICPEGLESLTAVSCKNTWYGCFQYLEYFIAPCRVIMKSMEVFKLIFWGFSEIVKKIATFLGVCKSNK